MSPPPSAGDQVRLGLPEQLRRLGSEGLRSDSRSSARTGIIGSRRGRVAIAHHRCGEAVGPARISGHIAVGRLLHAVAVGIAQIDRIVLGDLFVERVDGKRHRGDRFGRNAFGERGFTLENDALFAVLRHLHGDFVGPGADGSGHGGIAVERPLAERRTADFQRHGRGFIAREGEFRSGHIERIVARQGRSGLARHDDGLHGPALPFRSRHRQVEVAENMTERHGDGVFRLNGGHRRIGEAALRDMCR